MYGTQSYKKELFSNRGRQKVFYKIYEQAVAKGDDRMIKFCKDIFNIYDKHGINGHIKRPNGK